MGRPQAAGSGRPAPDEPPKVTREIAAEAAVWVTRLHGPSRTRQMELECLAWQQRSAAHREAFERCTETWESVPRLTLANAFAAAQSGGASLSAVSSWRRQAARWAPGIAAVLVVLSVGLGYQEWRDRDLYVTGVGEQRLVVLDDGSRLTLNTGTALRVDLDAARRSVTVERGEALFEVAKDPGRPFVVHAGESEVEALGTVFTVRYAAMSEPTADRLAVTLIEGRVAVRPVEQGGDATPVGVVTMGAGDRVRVGGAVVGRGAPAEVRVDRPDVDQITAWRRRQVVFDDDLLPQAVAEMNRYSRTPIVLLDGSGLEGLRVSGLYGTGDAEGFANAVANLHGLQVRHHDGRLELTRPHP